MLPEKQLQQLHVGHRGVYNDPHKNCCWAAACLQVMLRDPVFGELVLTLDIDTLPHSAHGQVVRETIKLAHGLAAQHRAPVVLEDLTQAWAQLQKDVVKHQGYQRGEEWVEYCPAVRVELCALNAFVFLLNCFREALTEACDLQALTRLQQMFNFRTVEGFACDKVKCPKRVLPPAEHSMLILPINKCTTSLAGALADYFFTERMDGRKCEMCGSSEGGFKSDRLIALPAKLMIQLKRAQYQNHTTKCSTKVSYPAAFDLAPFCTKEVLANGYQTTCYSLTAAIIHRGGGHGGHYTCFTKVAPGEYLYRNDACAVQGISEAKALSYHEEVHGLFYTAMLTSGEEPTLATLPEPSEVVGPTGPDGMAKVFLPWDTHPSHMPDICLPAPASSKPASVKQVQPVPAPVKQLQPVPQQSPAQRPVSVAALEHNAALQEKARAAKSKLAEAEAKLAARQSRYALAEGGSIHHRNIFELPEVGASSANPLALTALSRKEQRKARQALQSAQKAAAPSDQPRTNQRALLRATKLNMASPSLASTSEAASSQMVLVPAAQSSFPSNPVLKDIQPSNYDSCSTREAEEVREEGKDVSAGEVAAPAVPEEVEVDSQADATGLAQPGEPAIGVEKIKVAMDSVPQSPVRIDSIGAHWPSVTGANNTQGASQEAASGEADSSSTSNVAETQVALPPAADVAQEHSWTHEADGADLSGVQQPAPVHQKTETYSLAKDVDVSESLNDAGTRLSLDEAHGSAPMVEEGNMELHGVSDVAKQASESGAAVAQSENGMSEEDAPELKQALEGEAQGGTAVFQANRLGVDEAQGAAAAVDEGITQLHGATDLAMSASESEAAAQGDDDMAEEEAQEIVQADGMSLVAAERLETGRHSPDAALSSRMVADATDGDQVSIAASLTHHSDHAEPTASPEEVQPFSNAAMSADVPGQASGSTRLDAGKAEALSSLSALSAGTLPQGTVWSSADAATVDSLLSSLIAEAASQAGMPADCQDILIDAANSGAADAQTRSADGGPYDTQTAAVYHSAAFEGHQVEFDAGAAMSVDLEGKDSVDVAEMNSSAMGSDVSDDQAAERTASVGVQGLQAKAAALDSQDYVDAGAPEGGMLDAESGDEGRAAGIRLHSEMNGFGTGSGAVADATVEGHASVGVQGLQANGAVWSSKDHVDAGAPEVGTMGADRGGEGSTAGMRRYQEVAPNHKPHQQIPTETNPAQQDPPLPTPPQQDPPLPAIPQEDPSLATRPQHESMVQTPVPQEAALQDLPQQPQGRLLQQSSEEAAMPEPACEHKPGQQDRHRTRFDTWGHRMYFAAGMACGLGQGLWHAWTSDAKRQHT